MKVVLAPLAGFTDGPFRRMCYEGGADLCYTEMVSAPGLAHGNEPTRELLELMPGEGPVAVQLFGAKEADLAAATAAIEQISRSSAPLTATPAHRFSELNLNAGCPMTKVTKCGAGAKLIEDPEKVYRLLKSMTDNTSLPVTLKTRLGPHPQRTVIFELLDAAERAGAKGLIVHARYTSQMHGGAVHLNLLEEVVARARIPVTGNGSVVDLSTARAMAATGVSAIMIGRAVLNNPTLFKRLKMSLSADAGASETAEEQGSDRPSIPLSASAAQLLRLHLEYLLEFRRLLAAKYAHVPSEDGYASVKMHTHLFRYFNGSPGAAKLRARLNQVRTLDEIRRIINE